MRELQAGSTAMVHLVEDMSSGKPYAVKLLPRSGCDLGTAREVSCRVRQAVPTAPADCCLERQQRSHVVSERCSVASSNICRNEP